MNTILRSWNLMKSSYLLLMHDKELLVLPVLSGVVTALILASFFIPLVVIDTALGSTLLNEETPYALYALLFAVYFLTYAVSYFFNAAIISSAIFRMRGGDPTVMGGLKAAWKHIGRILGLAFFSASVGLLMKVLEGKSKNGVNFLSGLIGVAWSLASYLVLPVLIMERRSAWDALKESASLVKSTWGEQLSGSAGFIIIGILFMAVPFFMIFMLAGIGVIPHVGVAFALMFIIGLAGALVITTLQSIYRAALYVYARTGTVPEEFNAEALHRAGN